MRKAILHITSAHGSHTETYREGDRNSFPVGASEASIHKWADSLLKHFNDTLRAHEVARTLTKLDILDDPDQVEPNDHAWVKVSLFTVMRRRSNYDKMRCERCGVTGKRYGLGQGGVRIDSTFRAVAFKTCAGALKLLKVREARRKREEP